MQNHINFGLNWVSALKLVLRHGYKVCPRGLETLELPHQTIVVDMRKPVLKVPRRKLNYKFMAAEAYWILSGDDRVSTIAPYNKHISKFSDNGITFFGAYGPKIYSQLDFVVNKLKQDAESRHAGIVLWHENPPDTKDVPCTIAIWCQIRQGLLNMHVFMRSSDLWLGLPYDVFNFSMLGHLLSIKLGLPPGLLYLTAASSHLYQQNFKAAQELITYQDEIGSQPDTPLPLLQSETVLMSTLKDLRESTAGDVLRWWEAKL